MALGGEDAEGVAGEEEAELAGEAGAERGGVVAGAREAPLDERVDEVRDGRVAALREREVVQRAVVQPRALRGPHAPQRRAPVPVQQRQQMCNLCKSPAQQGVQCKNTLFLRC